MSLARVNIAHCMPGEVREILSSQTSNVILASPTQVSVMPTCSHRDTTQESCLAATLRTRWTKWTRTARHLMASPMATPMVECFCRPDIPGTTILTPMGIHTMKAPRTILWTRKRRRWQRRPPVDIRTLCHTTACRHPILTHICTTNRMCRCRRHHVCRTHGVEVVVAALAHRAAPGQPLSLGPPTTSSASMEAYQGTSVVRGAAHIRYPISENFSIASAYYCALPCLEHQFRVLHVPLPPWRCVLSWTQILCKRVCVSTYDAGLSCAHCLSSIPVPRDLPCWKRSLRGGASDSGR